MTPKFIGLTSILVLFSFGTLGSAGAGESEEMEMPPYYGEIIHAFEGLLVLPALGESMEPGAEMEVRVWDQVGICA